MWGCCSSRRRSGIFPVGQSFCCYVLCFSLSLSSDTRGPATGRLSRSSTAGDTCNSSEGFAITTVHQLQMQLCVNCKGNCTGNCKGNCASTTKVTTKVTTKATTKAGSSLLKGKKEETCGCRKRKEKYQTYLFYFYLLFNFSTFFYKALFEALIFLCSFICSFVKHFEFPMCMNCAL